MADVESFLLRQWRNGVSIGGARLAARRQLREPLSFEDVRRAFARFSWELTQ